MHIKDRCREVKQGKRGMEGKDEEAWHEQRIKVEATELLICSRSSHRALFNKYALRENEWLCQCHVRARKRHNTPPER